MSAGSDASAAAMQSHNQHVIDETTEIEAVEPVMPAPDAEETNPFEQADAAAAPSAAEPQTQPRSRSPSRSRSHSHPHPHDAHSHAAPLLMGSSHGAYVQGAFDLHTDLALDADAPSTAAAAADTDDDPNPFDTLHLPAHSRAVHHRLDVAPAGAGEGEEKLECADEIVPPWREEMRTLLTLALPAVLINLTSVAVSPSLARTRCRSN